ncbi:hypothetical protein GUITHDRAFT_132940 [Guillardia theta CCMP2712]|uniref:PHD-type domain-containing protein n=1 Tax=Guillardia theta (strain CCMP2712) TaxID=905079 RepID=L1JX63_GUITC|nr:hypothetical protein GUITHDRAFT_132940 [Guillardia theta CCMP2712]EKX53176.1 hypothetical protein GUITHDRAFT_132940 [Guillardia theta CCMP2712]|eukprot:XP_005840156.1 hypothetical protein GUITHDRAFT_132940 [Guillardia theta CCMP2712]
MGRRGEANKEQQQHQRLRCRTNVVDYSIMNGTWGPIISDFNAVDRNLHNNSSPVRERQVPERRSDGKGKKPVSNAANKDVKPAAGKARHTKTFTKPEKKQLTGNRLLAKKRLKEAPDHSNGDPTLENSGHRALRIRNRIKTRLTNARYFQTMLDAYEQDGWGPSSHRKLKPTEELKKSSESLIHAKKEIKELLKQMDPASNELAQKETRIDEREYEAEGLAFEKIVCSICGTGDARRGNDILLCDYSECNRAFHQKCHHPQVTELPHDDEDWFCTHCLCYTDCIEAVNELFGTHYTTWEKMFPELEENASNELSSEEYNSQEDDDYDPDMDEILSDDNKSVHSESVSEEHSDDEDSDKSTDEPESTTKSEN